MDKKYIIQKKIDIFLNKFDIYNKNIVKVLISRVLAIDSKSINGLIVRNGCINVFTKNYLYKIQLYGENIKKDLYNRKLFCSYDRTLLSPIKVYMKAPIIIIMPLLDSPTSYDDIACSVLNVLKRFGQRIVFKLTDYPLITTGLNILENFEYGKQAKIRLQRYLQKWEGTVLNVGLVHGDFHRGNIMQHNKKTVLIDFDCARDNDIQAVDALYYILEEIRSKHQNRKVWVDEWIFFYENIRSIKSEYRYLEQVDIDLKLGLILLLLERLGQEQYEYFFMIQNRNIINKVNRKIVKKYMNNVE